MKIKYFSPDGKEILTQELLAVSDFVDAEN
jgi:hypothetical protein